MHIDGSPLEAQSVKRCTNDAKKRLGTLKELVAERPKTMCLTICINPHAINLMNLADLVNLANCTNSLVRLALIYSPYPLAALNEPFFNELFSMNISVNISMNLSVNV